MPATSDRKAERDQHGAVGLKYVGQGAAFPDVPSRDLTADEVEVIIAHLVTLSETTATEDAPALTKSGARKLLLNSGLYEEGHVAAPPAPAPPPESEA